MPQSCKPVMVSAIRKTTAKCVCIYIHAHFLCECMYINIHIYIYIHMYIYISMFIYVHRHIYMNGMSGSSNTFWLTVDGKFPGKVLGSLLLLPRRPCQVDIKFRLPGGTFRMARHRKSDHTLARIYNQTTRERFANQPRLRFAMAPNEGRHGRCMQFQWRAVSKKPPYATKRVELPFLRRFLQSRADPANACGQLRHRFRR